MHSLSVLAWSFSCRCFHLTFGTFSFSLRSLPLYSPSFSLSLYSPLLSSGSPRSILIRLKAVPLFYHPSMQSLIISFLYTQAAMGQRLLLCQSCPVSCPACSTALIFAVILPRGVIVLQNHVFEASSVAASFSAGSAILDCLLKFKIVNSHFFGILLIVKNRMCSERHPMCL